ncbi:hypothetical protein IQ241_21065 [Romeria aff. gracilis LEGE 07310]|uniref:Uncharacterized protein n=1 Tax=Vasconcelosia minhoensis LEGE 07310 TaxID=915328 RepID=A0A8J7B082_9CYAN|nr:hypothetical protein [Romeria gracilis]MBE9079752.1 hypothetical protein [Romeria aff. gracilis LEGE 07310]
MSKPDFQAMSQKDLRAYMLAHQDDQEAFYAYVDRLYAEANWVEMPPLQSIDDLKNYPELVERVRRRSDWR